MTITLQPGQHLTVGCGGAREVHGNGTTPTGLCLSCGVITTDRDAQGSPRCTQLPKCEFCGYGMRLTGQGQTTHPNCDPAHLMRVRVTRDLERLGMGWCTCADIRRPAGDCPHCKEFAARLGGAR
jgi:hypothetical protein